MPRQYQLIDTETGLALEVCKAPMSGNIMFNWVPKERGTVFEIDVCCSAIDIINLVGTPQTLRIEEVL